MARYEWKAVGWGQTPHERIKEPPTEEELRRAQVVIIRYTNVDDPNDVRFATLRHPVGFLGFQDTAFEDLALFVEDQADRYTMELANNTP